MSLLKWPFTPTVRATFIVTILLTQQTTAFAQALSGTIAGTVTDPSGAAVTDAAVTLTNAGSGFTRAVTTNASGQYVAASIPTGIYTVGVQKQGFRRLTRESIELTAADTATVNLVLAIGDVTQEVQITAAQPLLEAQNADVSQLIDNRRIIEMPLNGRTFTSLLLLTPGAHSGSNANLGE